MRSTDGAPQSFPVHEWRSIGRVEWLPDGSGLLVIAGKSLTESQLWLVSGTEPERRQLTRDLFTYRTVSVTADSQTIVTVAADTTSAIWTLPRDGSAEPRKISSGKYDGQWGLSCTPTGRILYRSLESGRPEIWSMNEDGTDARQITTDGTSSWPFAMPDGRSMLFVSTRSGTQNIWRIGLDGEGAVQLERGGSSLYPAATPDGGWVYFVSTSTGRETVWRMPTEGGAAEQVLESFSSRPAISPDGRQMALYFAEPGAFTGLAVMPVAGGTPTARFAVNPAVAFGMIRWTPDGKGLLHNAEVNDRANVWLQPLAGGPAQAVTRFADQVVFAFDVTADGKRLVIARGVLSRDAVRIRNFR